MTAEWWCECGQLMEVRPDGSYYCRRCDLPKKPPPKK